MLPTIIERRIYLIRGHKVMLDSDLADLYGIATGRLNEQVRRNAKRFPRDFAFELTAIEFKRLITHFAISNPGRGGRRKLPLVFTQEGVAMLSGALHSPKAVEVNIAIMRAFVRLREIISTHKDLAHKLEKLERRVEDHDGHIQNIFDAIEQLQEPAPEPPRCIGFRTD